MPAIDTWLEGGPLVTEGKPALPPPVTRTIPFGDQRSAMVVLPYRDAPSRLLVMIHGVCTPPSYVCGEWKRAAAEVGLLVCPVGNATCGEGGVGAPSWEESFAAIDEDVEASIKATLQRVPGRMSRDGAVLAGYSRGGYAAVILAIRHPRRWPILIVNEANVDLTPAMAQAAGLRAVAFIAGEWGDQLAGERQTAETLAATGFPARLWTMPKTGHPYSPDIEGIMKEALDFVLAHEHDH